MGASVSFFMSFISILLCVYKHEYVCPGACAEVKGELKEVSSLLPLCEDRISKETELRSSGLAASALIH